MNNQIISPAALISLKDALSKIYWYKKDLRAFIEYSIKNTTIVSTIDWNNEVKYNAVSSLVDRMSKRDDIYFDDLMSLIHNVCDFQDYSHFDRIDKPDAQKWKKTAKEAVNALRENCQGYFEELESKRRTSKAKNDFSIRQRETDDFNKQIDTFYTRYRNLITTADPQKRGYDFEKFLNELFYFFDLNPRSPFKIAGEQIDGAFTHDNHDYLLEAKWCNGLTQRKEIDIFAAKISRKLKNTLGLLISFNGFVDLTDTPIRVDSLILMDGQDLILVLEKRISLSDLIRLKRRHASETGEIMHRIIT